MTDTEELIKRISEFTFAYRDSGYKAPLFRLTPHEYQLLNIHLMDKTYFTPEFYGDLPMYLGANFELVGKPVLLNGHHIRSDSGIDFKTRAKRSIKKLAESLTILSEK